MTPELIRLLREGKKEKQTDEPQPHLLPYVLMALSSSSQAMGVYGALTKTPVPGPQDAGSRGNSRDAQDTDPSLDEELDRVKLS